MRILAIMLCLVFLLPLGAEASQRPLVLPQEYDWSSIGTIDANYSIYNDGHPAMRDEDGYFHIVSFADGVMEYTVLDPIGEIADYHDVEIPGLSSEATAILIPEGLLVLWQRQEEDGVSLYYAKTQEDQVLETGELDYIIPGTPGKGLDMFEVIQGFRVAYLDGKMHLLLVAGDEELLQNYYLKFGDYEMVQVEALGRASHRPRDFMLGEIGLDAAGNVYILHTNRQEISLTTFDAGGKKALDIGIMGSQVFTLENEAWNEYTRRGRAPAMLVGPDGTMHIAFNNLTRPPSPREGGEHVDIIYRQITPDGNHTVTRVLARDVALSRFPTVTLLDDRVTVTWEQPFRSGDQRLYFTTMTLDGEIIFDHVQLTPDEGFASSGLVWLDEDNHLTGIWWLGPGGEKTMAHKNTRNPAGTTMWNRFGVVSDYSDRPPLEQIIYWFSMVMLFAVARLFGNLHVLLVVIFALFVLHKLHLLDMAKSKPWVLVALVLLTSYVFLSPMELAEGIVGEGYFMFSAMAATIVFVLCSLVIRIRYHNTLNLVLGCVCWLYLVMVLQVMPVIQYMMEL